MALQRFEYFIFEAETGLLVTEVISCNFNQLEPGATARYAEEVVLRVICVRKGWPWSLRGPNEDVLLLLSTM